MRKAIHKPDNINLRDHSYNGGVHGTPTQIQSNSPYIVMDSTMPLSNQHISKNQKSDPSKRERVLNYSTQKLERVEPNQCRSLMSEVIMPESENTDSGHQAQTYSYEELLEYLNLVSDKGTNILAGSNDNISISNNNPKEEPQGEPKEEQLSSSMISCNEGIRLTKERLELISDKIIQTNTQSLPGGNPKDEAKEAKDLKKVGGPKSFKEIRSLQIEKVLIETDALELPQIKEVALGYAEVLINEVNCSKRLINIELSQIKEEIFSLCKRAMAYTFKSGRNLLNHIFRGIEKVIKETANKAQSQAIITKLRSGDLQFASDFFFGLNPNGLNLYRISNNIQYDILRKYQISLSHRVIATYLYELFMEDNWAILDRFKYHGTLFSWMSKISIHGVVARLREEGYIMSRSSLTNSNILEKITTMDAVKRNQMIDELIQDKVYRQALKSYFSAMDKGGVCEKSSTKKALQYGSNSNVIEKGKKMLHQRLQDQPEDMNGFVYIEDIAPRTVQFNDYSREINKTCEVSEETVTGEADPLAQIITRHPQFRKDLDYEQNLLNITLDSMPLSKRDRKILKLRVVNRMSTTEIGKSLGIATKTVSQICYRITPALCKEIEKWWRLNVNPDFQMKRVRCK